MTNFNKWVDYSDKLRADDKRFDNNIVLCYGDGSHSTFLSSFAIEEKDELIIITEHCGVYIVPRKSLNFYYSMKEEKVVNEKPKTSK